METAGLNTEGQPVFANDLVGKTILAIAHNVGIDAEKDHFWLLVRISGTNGLVVFFFSPIDSVIQESTKEVIRRKEIVQRDTFPLHFLLDSQIYHF